MRRRSGRYTGPPKGSGTVTRKPGALANAPRDPTPQRLEVATGEFTREQVVFARDIGVCYNLVNIASYILKNPKIRLKIVTEADGIVRPCTDGTIIYLPKMIPRRRIVLKHEISHLYFKSNIPLRLLFVKDLVRKVEAEAKTTFGESTRARLIEDLCFVINIFDDLRVNSLWGLLYPGDGDEMEEWYQGEIGPRMLAKANEDYPNGDIPHLFTYMILLCLGQPAKSTEWGEFEADIKWAAGQVYFKNFNASLLLVRDLVLKIARKVAADATPPPPSVNLVNPTERPDDDPELQEAQAAVGGGEQTPDPDLDGVVKERIAEGGPKKKEPSPEPNLVTALSKMTEAVKPSPEFVDDNAGFDFKDGIGPGDVKSLELDMGDLEELIERPLEDVLQDLEQNAVEEVEEIQRAIAEKKRGVPGQNFRTEDEFLRKNVMAKIHIHRIAASSIAPYPLSVWDIEQADKWKKFFQRVMGTLANRTYEEGDELLVDLYIDQKVNREPLSCFRVATSTRGFRVNTLVDMSGSMAPVFPEVEKLSRVLGASLNFPFVKLNTWGFNSREAGQVDMYRFPKNAQGFRSQNSKTEGVTPLSHAIQIAGRELTGYPDENHLFVVSDGFPVYNLAGSKYSVSTKTLFNWTAEAVRDLKRQKVNVYCLMIGGHTPEARDMDRMFGQGFWKTVRKDQMYNDAFTLIREKFLRFLRTR